MVCRSLKLFDKLARKAESRRVSDMRMLCDHLTRALEIADAAGETLLGAKLHDSLYLAENRLRVLKQSG